MNCGVATVTCSRHCLCWDKLSECGLVKVSEGDTENQLWTRIVSIDTGYFYSYGACTAVCFRKAHWWIQSDAVLCSKDIMWCDVMWFECEAIRAVYQVHAKSMQMNRNKEASQRFLEAAFLPQSSRCKASGQLHPQSNNTSTSDRDVWARRDEASHDVVWRRALDDLGGGQ